MNQEELNELNHEQLIEKLREDTQRLIEQMHERDERDKETFRKYLVNGYDMLCQAPESVETLLEPLLPRVGVVGLVGSSDTGKSTLLRGLAMAVASGAKHFLGLELRAKHRRAIYVATEDDSAAVAVLMQRQLEELCTPKEAFTSLDFIFDTTDLMDNLDKMLEDKPRDLVIVDAFADLYTGPMNENNRVRSFLNGFSQLATKHSVLFIFLHHTGKRTETLAPSKHNAIGSQGFEAKMRVLLELRRDPTRHDIRHLCVVKGNYLSDEYKHDSFVLRFTDSLNFEATGERVPFGLLRERTEDDEELLAKVERARALREEGMSYRQIAEELGYKSRTSVLNLLNQQADSSPTASDDCPF